MVQGGSSIPQDESVLAIDIVLAFIEGQINVTALGSIELQVESDLTVLSQVAERKRGPWKLDAWMIRLLILQGIWAAHFLEAQVSQQGCRLTG